MSASPTVRGNQPTIFVGIVDKNYTEEMWNIHMNRLADLFEITDPSMICQIKVGSLASHFVDGENLHQQIMTAKRAVNQINVTLLRIVGLGIGSSESVTQALESFVREWNIPSNKKEVQFVALGESIDCHYLNFCKSLVLKQRCQTLQYYNTMDFDEHGYFRSNRTGNEGIQHLDPLQLASLLGGAPAASCVQQ